MTYKEKLLDPRWQQKRLRILERDNWQCQFCYSPVKTLHVHHKFYIAGKDPWEYPDEYLLTLCSECHKEVKSLNNSINDLIPAIIGNVKFECDMEPMINFFQRKDFQNETGDPYLMIFGCLNRLTYEEAYSLLVPYCLKKIKNTEEATSSLTTNTTQHG